MNYLELYHQIVAKKSFLCVGLDTDIRKIPQFLMGAEDPIFAFNKEIIDSLEDIKWWNLQDRDLRSYSQYMNNPKAFCDEIRNRINDE